MRILTNLLLLASSIKFTTQMSMRCESLDALVVSCFHRYLVANIKKCCNIFSLRVIIRKILGSSKCQSVFIHFRSGSVCLDVINQTWSPMFGKLSYLFVELCI